MPRGALSPAAEQALAWDARNAEADAHQILAPIAAEVPAIAEALRPMTKRRTTRFPSIVALEAAVDLLGELPRYRREYAQALMAVNRARSKRWELARSAARIAYGEARKVAGPMEADDLAQEGFIGLYNAALRFDPALELRFSTYARWWARAAITRAVDQQGRAVRMPAGAIEERRNMLKLLREADGAGRSLTPHELAEQLGLTVERVHSLQRSLDDTSSLDAPTGPDSGLLRGEVTADTTAADPVEDMATQATAARIARALDMLDDRHRRAIELLYGFDGGGKRSLVEVGAAMGFSKEWVRKLRNEGLRLLREELASWE